MKRFILPILLYGMVTVASAQYAIDAAREKVVVRVKNPNNTPLTDAPVVLSVENPRWRSATVFDGRHAVPSQFDILDGGDTRELSFVVDFRAGQTKKVAIVFSEAAPDESRYTYRVHAQMFMKEDGARIPKDEISSDRDNMYNRVEHHGPAFESELAAYRLYFDSKQTVDIYGKVIKRIELPETMWYPSDMQLEEKYGDDVLFVGQSVGLGTLKGWEEGRATHISRMAERKMKVLAKGPVRAIVELDVNGWQYGGTTINLRSRYYIYAGHRDTRVEHTITGDGVSGINFATGVQKIRKGDIMHTDGRGMVSDWGRDFPVTDTVKYPQQTVGLAVAIPEKYVVSQQEDDINYLYVVKPDEDGRIDYRITFAAEKEEFGYKSADEFFRYVDGWREELPVEIIERRR